MAQKYFTDRIIPHDVFTKSIQSIPEKPAEIICFYGKGGIGKTSLLKKLMRYSTDVYASAKLPSMHNIFVSLDAFDYANPVNILMTIRNSIVGDCGIFDYALLQYYAKARLTLEEISQKSKFFSSPLLDLVNDALSLGTLSLAIPTSLLQNGMSLIKDFTLKLKYRDEISEMDSLTEFELFERLPYYLGLSISHAAEKGHYHVIFLDSYESLLARTVSTTASTEADEWLKELFLASENIRFVIASRDKIRWCKADEEWNLFLNQHLLKNLSDEDSRWFLEQVPIHDEVIINEIIKHAGGVPLYLDMCADIYADSINSNLDFDTTQLQKGSQIIDRYIRHLSSKNKYAVKVLSLLRSFDKFFANSLLRRHGMEFHADELEELFEKSIFLEIEDSYKLWKIDESVRLHLQEQLSYKDTLLILKNILACISDLRDPSGFRFFTPVLEMVIEKSDYLSEIQEMIVENIDFFSNAGYWNELHTILATHIDDEHPMLRAIAVVEELIYIRRTGTLADAILFAEKHPISQKELGYWYYMYRYLILQIQHLQGNYAASMNGYKLLIEEMDLIHSLIPSHIYNTITMKYADILFLKGNFKESLSIVNRLMESYEVPIDDHIELLRIKGHIYRFQKEFEKAAFIYQSALDITQVSKLVAHQGKLYTNMTETLCNHKPNEALDWFRMANDIHKKNSNYIELGKAQAAVSVAYTNLKEFENALFYANEALASAKKTGYLSGQAFALAALEYYYKQTNDVQKASETRETLVNLIQKIDVYHYILT